MKDMFYFKDVVGDGQCFFRAIALGYQENEKYHARVKTRMLEWCLNDRSDLHAKIRSGFYGTDNKDWEDCLRRLRCSSAPTMNTSEWGGDMLQPVAEAVFDIRIFIWNEPTHGNGSYQCYRRPFPHHDANKPPKKVLHFLNKGNVHYVLLEPNRDYIGSGGGRTATVKPVSEVIDLAAEEDDNSVLERNKEKAVSNDRSAAQTSVPQRGSKINLRACLEDTISLLNTSSEKDKSCDTEWKPPRKIETSETPDGLRIHVPLRRTLSTRSDTQSNASSNSSRVSYSDYSRCYGNLSDVVSQFRERFNLRETCCPDGCIGIRPATVIQGLDDGYVFFSKIVDHPIEMLHLCRQEIFRKKERERSRWLYDKFQDAARTSEFEKDEVSAISFGKFCLEYSATMDNESGDTQRMRFDVCERAFNFVYAVGDRMARRFKSDIRYSKGDGVHISTLRQITRDIADEAPETRFLSDAELFAVAFIKEYCERTGEYIPNRALEVIRISYPKKYVYEAYCNMFAEDDKTSDKTSEKLSNLRHGKPLSISKFYDLWNDHCAHIELARWKGEFAMCDVCKKHAKVEASAHTSAEEKKANRIMFKRHLKTVQVCRMGYYDRQMKAILHPNIYLSKIIDGCDSNTTTLPNMKTKSKSEESLSENIMKCKLMGARVHGMRNRDYLYLAPPFAATSLAWNYTLETLMRTLAAEEKFRAENKMGWPTTLFLQLDNTSKDNKNSFVKAFLSVLVLRGVFEEIQVNYLPVGHTHEDIDQLFSVLTYALKYSNAYTFPQWKDIVLNAFNDECLRPHSVEWVSMLHNYKEWLSPHVNTEYHNYRSEVYHFRFIRSNDRKSAHCFYSLFDYCATNVERYGGYYPKDPQPPLNWLKGAPNGAPSLDLTAGEWYQRKTRDDVPEPVDITERQIGLRKLLQCETNSASDADIAWWDTLFASMPKAGEIPKDSGMYWSFSFPNAKKLRRNCAAEYIDMSTIDDVDPISPPKHELITTKTWTAGLKRSALQMEKEERELETSVIKLCRNQFVLFLIDEGWQDLTAEQKGLPPDALKWGFLLGKITADDTGNAGGDIEDVEDQDTKVAVWYPSNGDATEVWVPWIRHLDVSGRSTATSKGSPWVVDIPRTSVIMVDPQFTKCQKRDRRKLCAQTLKKLVTFPELQYCYLQGTKGLVTKAEATAILESNYREVKGSRSTAGRAKESKALSVLTAHKRCLEYIATRQSIHKRACVRQNFDQFDESAESGGNCDDAEDAEDAEVAES